MGTNQAFASWRRTSDLGMRVGSETLGYEMICYYFISVMVSAHKQDICKCSGMKKKF